MPKLNDTDIECIAKGYRNTYVEAQDKDELLKELATMLLEKNNSDWENIVDNKIDNIRMCLNNIEDKLDDDNDCEQLEKARLYLGELENVLSSIA